MKAPGIILDLCLLGEANELGHTLSEGVEA